MLEVTLYLNAYKHFIIRQEMLSSEIFTGRVFHAEKNLRMRKLVSATKKANQNMRGAVWGVFSKLLHYLFV